MILILGGTTEGRLAVQVADQSDKPFYYSTRGSEQEVHSTHGVRISGGMNTSEMVRFCQTNQIRLLIDAAHPFAINLHQTVSEAAQLLSIPVIRLERVFPPRTDAIIWCDDYADAISKLEEHHIERLLALSGVQTIAKLKPYWTQHPECMFRVLEREESVQIAIKEGFPKEQICFYKDKSKEAEQLEAIAPQAILTKESGISGGFCEKVEAAHELGIQVFAVKRPQLPEEFITVHGEFGLRKTIEQQLPEFYPLRIGFTTGSCATAATKAALIALLKGSESPSVCFHLPNGEELRMPISQTELSEGKATCSVCKDAGDDPDVTNGVSIVSTVTLLPLDDLSSEHQSICAEQIIITGGIGVGRVTLPGLGLPIGGAAINITPQRMIRENLLPLVEEFALYNKRILVTISVPEGEKIAERTFNPRLGIINGISIIGTSGIVRPFSSDAFIRSIKKEMEVASAIGAKRIVLNSGAKSERFIKKLYPELPPQAFIHYGNFIGESLRLAASLDIKEVTLGIMMGKAVKLAEGYLDTHSKKVVMNRSFIAHLLKTIECSPEIIGKVEQLNLARELWDLLPADKLKPFCRVLIERCHHVCSEQIPEGDLTILLIDEEGNCLQAD